MVAPGRAAGGGGAAGGAAADIRVDNPIHAAADSITTMPPPRSQYADVEISRDSHVCCPSALSCCLSTTFFCGWLSACTTVSEREALVLLNFGKLNSVITKPGLYCVNPCGMEARKCPTMRMTIDLPDTRVLDSRGSPLMISGVVTYLVTDVVLATLEVANVGTFVKDQSLVTLKSICSRYPYESSTGGASLKGETAHLQDELIHSLQSLVSIAGVKVLGFRITDLAYAREIAASMLVRQQAEALIEARRTVVDGAVTIARDAVRKLEESGVAMDDHEKARLTSNLLTVVCGDAKVQPTLSMN